MEVKMEVKMTVEMMELKSVVLTNLTRTRLFKSY
ncbi:hypothetical protein COLO4_25336 [Corchorus olitorius]|uniref:Uncharacterized protein n=1 Tax=Corchorus olitorius TaxID=93759 RepID=A0A1R3I3E4_9ROSI|nr:hypothetical protein COLO4_25336 [Corchorus olitorius]